MFGAIRVGAIARLLGVLAMASPATALAARPESEQAIGLAPVEYEGVVPDHEQKDIHETLVRGIERIGRDPRIFETCMNRRCTIRQARKDELRFVIELRVAVDDRDVQLRAIVHGVEDAKEVATREELCELCGHNELLETIEALTASLEPILAREEASPRVRVEGDPSGAQLLLDGVPVGRAPLLLEVSPGPHQIEVRSEGRAGQIHEWRATHGVEEQFAYELGQVVDPGIRRMQVGAWTTVGLGLAGLGAGAALVAIDGREYTPSCTPERRDLNGTCPNVYTTGVAGFVTIGLGAAALITGTSLVIVANHRKRRGRASRPKQESRRVKARVVPTLGGLGLQF